MRRIALADGSEAEELSPAEGYALLDKETRKLLGMSAADFIHEWQSGRLSNGVERPEVTRLALLIPFADGCKP